MDAAGHVEKLEHIDAALECVVAQGKMVQYCDQSVVDSPYAMVKFAQ